MQLQGIAGHSVCCLDQQEDRWICVLRRDLSWLFRPDGGIGIGTTEGDRQGADDTVDARPERAWVCLRNHRRCGASRFLRQDLGSNPYPGCLSGNLMTGTLGWVKLAFRAIQAAETLSQ